MTSLLWAGTRALSPAGPGLLPPPPACRRRRGGEGLLAWWNLRASRARPCFPADADLQTPPTPRPWPPHRALRLPARPAAGVAYGAAGQRRAKLSSAPAAMATTPVKAAGSDPQATTVPSLFSASEWNGPATMATTPARRAGTVDWP